MVSKEQCIELLNEINSTDPEVLELLINYRVPCNKELAVHPTIQVGTADNPKGYEVGLLGILNGIFGVREDGYGYICMNLDKGKITEFMITPPKKQKGD